MVLALLTLLGGRVAGAADTVTTPPPVVDVLQEWIEKESPPPPGRLLAILKAFGNVRIQVPPGCPGLFCPPGPTHQDAKLPQTPYDIEGNDCALVGRTAEVENYVKALDAMVLACLDLAERSHDAAVAAKALLGGQVELLSVATTYRVTVAVFELSLGWTPSRPMSPRGRDPATRFTRWLGDLTLQTLALCDEAHHAYEPLSLVCDELNRVLCAQLGLLRDERQRAQFHARLDAALREADAALESVRGWAAVLTAGLQALLEAFSEEAVVCERGMAPTDLLARHVAAMSFHDYGRSVEDAARRSRRSKVGVVLWLGGRLSLLEVPTAPLR
jgi:hypothetical protein